MKDLSDIPQDLLTQSVAGRRLDKKCIILTGAAGSIGSFITRQLLREGARVMLTGRDQSKLDGCIEDLVGEGFEQGAMVSATGDCADPAVCRDIVAKTVDAFGAVDILVNNLSSSSIMELPLCILFKSGSEFFRHREQAATHLEAGILHNSRSAF